MYGKQEINQVYFLTTIQSLTIPTAVREKEESVKEKSYITWLPQLLRTPSSQLLAGIVDSITNNKPLPPSPHSQCCNFRNTVCNQNSSFNTVLEFRGGGYKTHTNKHTNIKTHRLHRPRSTNCYCRDTSPHKSYEIDIIVQLKRFSIIASTKSFFSPYFLLFVAFKRSHKLGEICHKLGEIYHKMGEICDKLGGFQPQSQYHFNYTHQCGAGNILWSTPGWRYLWGRGNNIAALMKKGSHKVNGAQSQPILDFKS